MESSLSPREIQTRIRAGASVAEVAHEAGAPEERIQVFADPVLAEREHMARTALGAAVRRKGDGAGHRRLGALISDRLRARGLDADEVGWDAWREPDHRWRVVGKLADDAAGRVAEFLYDTRARFSIADNADARWMIGEELQGSGPDNENTVDFDDELALVRATQSPGEPLPDEAPDDAVPFPDERYADVPLTSELDELYDMLSGVSEDSVRIYVGLDDDDADDVPPAPTEPAAVVSPDGGAPADDTAAGDEPTPAGPADTSAEDETAPVGSAGASAASLPETTGEPGGSSDSQDTDPDAVVGDEPGDDADEESVILEPRQDSLIEDVPAGTTASPRKRRRGRAHVPSWDEIMFGGPKPNDG